jgi:hypothetical protein
MSERKIGVYRQGLQGNGVLKSEWDKPSDALMAATHGRQTEVRSYDGFRAQWYVAFPMEGSRWDIWYVW